MLTFCHMFQNCLSFDGNKASETAHAIPAHPPPSCSLRLSNERPSWDWCFSSHDGLHYFHVESVSFSTAQCSLGGLGADTARVPGWHVHWTPSSHRPCRGGVAGASWNTPLYPRERPPGRHPAVKAFSVTIFAQLPSEGLCPRRARAPCHHCPTAGPLAALLTFSQFWGGPCPHAPPWVTLASSSGPECTRQGPAGNRHTEGR